MTDPNKQRSIYAIAGPTASGKTALGVELALRVDGEVVNFDSVQIYREIEIATAKPTRAEMRGVPHHLIDYIDPRVNYTAADWARDAEATIAEIEGRDKVPVLVGGTGFYLRTLLRPLFDSPPTDVELRAKLQERRDKKGAGHLHQLLSRIDPEAARNLFPRDHVRVIRALEVYFQTGERISERQSDRQTPPEFASRVAIFVLDPPREELYARIDRRAEVHFDKGLVDEVKRLRGEGILDSTNALGSHGYRRVCEYLRSERTFRDAVDRTKQDVRNYSKRQLTWFRAEQNARWLEGFGCDSRLVDKILEYTD